MYLKASLLNLVEFPNFGFVTSIVLICQSYYINNFGAPEHSGAAKGGGATGHLPPPLGPSASFR